MALREFMHGRTGAVVAGAAVLVALGGVGGAVAANTIGSADIRNGAVRSVDIKDGGVRTVDIHNSAVTYPKLGSDVRELFRHHLEADGPYPGYTQLKQGANSTELWKADGGATLQQSWVQCAPGKLALGGGFSHADEGLAAYKGIQIVSSEPATIKDGKIVDTPIKGDPDMSIRPNGWLVEGFNNGTATDLSIRPWVVCAVMK